MNLIQFKEEELEDPGHILQPLYELISYLLYRSWFLRSRGRLGSPSCQGELGVRVRGKNNKLAVRKC